MRQNKITHVILAILIAIMSFGPAAYASSGSSKSLFGGECSVTCDAGTVPKCTAGLFSCECTCVASPGSMVYHTGSKPSLSSQQLSDAGSFVSYANAYGSLNMTNLGTKSSAVINAYSSGTTAAYNTAEDDWNTAFDALTSGERADVLAWAASHGY